MAQIEPTQASPSGRWQEVASRVRWDTVVFDGCYGVLHRPASVAARGVSVLLCPPVGGDQQSAYRSLAYFADLLAARGFGVLRYDHLGSGDSAALGRDADQWRAWRAGLEHAAAFARAHGGTDSLVLAGLRIGASLAALAAEAVRPAGLLLLAPVVTGKAWLRELQVAAAVAGAPQPRDGAIELDGLRLSPATAASLQTFDLRRLHPFSGPVWLATNGAAPMFEVGSATELSTVDFEGYSELFTEPHLNSPPFALFDRAALWLEGLARANGFAAPALQPPPARLATDDWIETPVAFGPGLRGVLCLPVRPSGRQGVIIGNTGGDPRGGIGGFGARACRALAGRGVAALRFDFSGLGESAPAGEDWSPHVYETSRTADFRHAAELLSWEGYDDIVLTGVCAGGYQALRAATEDPRFRRVVTINSWLAWRPSLSLEPRPRGAVVRRRVNLSALATPQGWRRLLGGQVDVAEVFRVLGRRLALASGLRRPDALALTTREAVTRLAADGARVKVLVGRDDESMGGLERDFGVNGRWLARHGVEVAVRRGLDHALFTDESQAVALDELYRFLDSGDAGAGRGGPRRASVLLRLGAALHPRARPGLGAIVGPVG